MTEDDRHCEEILPSGERCSAWKITGSAFCLMHTPSMRDEVQRMRSRGGKRQWSIDPETFANMEIRTLDECREYLNKGLILVAQGKIAPAQLQAMASGVQVMARLIDMADIDRRIEALEERVNRR